jgi:AraC-like DNA-binding protein
LADGVPSGDLSGHADDPAPMTGDASAGRPLHDVQIWRPFAERRMLALSGRTTTYSFSPVDEFVIGTTFQAPLVVQRWRDRHTLLPGQSCVWDPEHVHSGSAPAAEWSAQLVIVPACELVEALDDDVSLACRPGRITDGRSRGAVAALRRAIRSRDRLAIEVELTSVAHTMFSQRSRLRPTGPRAASQRLLAARDLLVDRLAENVTLAELAAAAGMDRFHFSRQFKSSFGQPPHAYRLGLRLLAAQRALEHGSPVAEVAVTSGFFDQSHLHRHFQRRFGLSPARYAAAFARPAPATDAG